MKLHNFLVRNTRVIDVACVELGMELVVLHQVSCFTPMSFLVGVELACVRYRFNFEIIIP